MAIKWRQMEQNGDKMTIKCDKNWVKMATKCDKNWVKMATKCDKNQGQNGDKMGSKWR